MRRLLRAIFRKIPQKITAITYLCDLVECDAFTNIT